MGAPARPSSARLRVFVAAVGALAWAAAGPVAAQAPSSVGPCTGPAPVPWRALEFRAHKFLLAATATLVVELEPAAEAAAALRTPSGGTGLAPLGPCVAILSFASDVPVGRDERARAWLEPASGAVLQVDKRTVSGGLYRKVFRYTPDGYLMWRSEPRDRREAAGDPDGWTRRKTATVGGRATLPAGAVVTDSYALLYVASLAGLDRPGARVTAYMLSDGGVAVVSFAAGGLTVRDADVELSWPGGGERRRRDTVARTVTVSAAPLGREATGDEVDLGLLGIRGVLSLAVDVETGVPLELSGRTAQLGTIRATLERAELAVPPPATEPGAPPPSR